MSSKLKWIIAILGISLALNVFGLGIFIGKGFRQPTEHKNIEPSIDFNVNRFAHTLNQADRRKFRALLKAERRDLSDGYVGMRAVERKIRDLINADEIDRGALRQALIDHGNEMQNLHAPLRKVMFDFIAELDLETRKKLAKDMFRKRARKMRRPPPPPRGMCPPGEDEHPDGRPCRRQRNHDRS